MKFLTENGVARLWAAIEQKFIDNNEFNTGVRNMIDDGLTDAEAMSFADIDAITGYTEPESSDEPAQNNGE